MFDLLQHREVDVSLRHYRLGTARFHDIVPLNRLELDGLEMCQ
jgi:hypothetical protein